MSWLLIWLLNAVALLLLSYLLPGVQIDGFFTALWVALLLGLVNAVVRPVLVLLTLPITLLTLGLFLLVINGLLFYLVAHLAAGFHVSSVGTAIVGALLYSLFSWVLHALVGTRRGDS
jgi:putative membrane protein